WETLYNREVLIWPDHDSAGSQAGQAIINNFKLAGCASIALLDAKALASIDPLNPDGPRREPPLKWDAADALIEWKDQSRLRNEVDKNSSLFKDGPAEAARDAESAPGEGVTIDHFYAYMPANLYIFLPTREMWPKASINARFPPIKIGTARSMTASRW